ncbi:hypothetical protein R6U77_02930 [Lysinibacillus louembei]|uniref:Orn/DAP/Arg decarboxylase 2 N-terminal domain-containing protein n=1 Tax=Lysinibacillus louembei TaxID=1470088 RepID=A0ABZ0RZE4_9BACI|nr:hypothetical protein [Lysinibacillus louembei]WPK12671.1 hypothetical protein R6U77_02930 [Lysinibacillus louembei]
MDNRNKKMDLEYLRKSSFIQLEDEILDSIPTPYIIYNLSHLLGNLNQIISIIEPDFFYIPIKANYSQKIHDFLAKHTDGADVASLGEIDLATSAKYKSLHLSTPFLTIDILKKANLRECDSIDLYSLHQANILISYFATNKKINNPSISLRLKVPYTSNNSETYLNNSRFGILYKSKEFDDVILLLKKNNIKIECIHIHIGEYNNFSVISQIQKFLEKITLDIPYLKRINLGGGFTSLFGKYTDNEIRDTFHSFKNNILKVNSAIKFIIEPGMLTLMSSGTLAVSCIDSINSKDIIVDISAFNFFSWVKPRLLPSISAINENTEITIYGTTCYEEDIVSEKVYVSKIPKIGEKIFLAPAGAYINSINRNLHMFHITNELYIFEGVIYES